jgi:hypothetical protein
MKGYFYNPEIKKSSITLLIIMMMFLMAKYMIIKVNNENLKGDYIRALGGITAKVVEINPELEGEIVPLLTRELTSQEEANGRKILRQYGLSESLKISLFPYINDRFRNSIYYMFLSIIILTGILFLLNYKQHGYYYKNHEFDVEDYNG